MHINYIPNRGSHPTILLRESYRENGKVCKRTVANITNWPDYVVEGLNYILKNKGIDKIEKNEELFIIEETKPHGHVEAVLGTIKKVGLDKLISSKRNRKRDLVLAMIVERLIHPCSKLATTRLWHTTTLAQELNVEKTCVDDLYDVLDWLLERQSEIEDKLARKHLSEGIMVLYDVSSSYYEGRTCPLMQYGHNRDKKKGKKIVVYGIMTDKEGVPISVDVYSGNTGDPATVIDQVDKLRNRFDLSRVVLVGDRGMLTQTNIDKLKAYPGIGWISALKSGSIKELAEDNRLQMTLFDKNNLAEISSQDYPDERLIACFNPFLKDERRRKRFDLICATEKELRKIKNQAARRTKKPLSKVDIGIKVGKVLNKFKVGKHFKLTIKKSFFNWERNEDSIKRESDLDGIYVIRTSERKEAMSAEETVRNYKSLSYVERAFRCLKGIDLLIRPVRHRTEDHVRAHIFLCMLSYYVEWYMRKALAPILFHDDELDENRKKRDPIAPAEASLSVKLKKKIRKTPDGLPVHSFDTLLAALGNRAKNRCRIKSVPKSAHFYRITESDPVQKKVFQLLGL